MNKIKVSICLLDEELKVNKKFKEEINYEEYLIMKEEKMFKTSKFNEEDELENLYIMKNIYNFDVKTVAIIVTKDESMAEKVNKE